MVHVWYKWCRFRRFCCPSMIKSLISLVSWKIIFHSGASSFYLSLLVTYLSYGNVVFVEKMVTTWYLALHIGFIFMALALDFVDLVVGKSSKIARFLESFNNLLFISVVFPFGLFVPLTYWSLFYYDCNLILPNIIEITLPNWVSTSSHSVISLVALLEMITTRYNYKGNYILALTTMSVFSVSYILCLIRAYVKFGFWVYPILHLVPDEELWMVFLALAAKLVVLFFFGAGISFLIHGDDNKNHVSNRLESSPNLSNAPLIALQRISISDKVSKSLNDIENDSISQLKPELQSENGNIRRSRNFSKMEDTKNESKTSHDTVYCSTMTSFAEGLKRQGSTPSRIGLQITTKPVKNHKAFNAFHLIQGNHLQISTPLATSSKPKSSNQQSKIPSLSNKRFEALRASEIDDKPTYIQASLVDNDMTTDSLEVLPRTPPPSLATLPSEPQNEEKTRRKIVNWSTVEEKPLVESTSKTDLLLQKNVSEEKQNAEVIIEPKKCKKKQKKEDKKMRRGCRDFLKKLSFGETNPNAGWSYLGVKSRRGVEKLDSEGVDLETKSLPANV